MGVYKRGKKCWYAFKWTVKHPDGTKEHFRIQRPARTGNKDEARTIERDHHSALGQGKVHPLDPWPVAVAVARPTITVKEFSKEFLEHAELHTKGGTKRFYSECLDRILGFSPIAYMPLNRVTVQAINGYAKWRKDQKSGNSIASINAELRTIRRMLKLAEEWAYIEKAPRVHELPGQKPRERVISFEEEALYLANATPNLKDAAILAVDTGVRPDSELFTLEWRNVHLEPSTQEPHGFIHIEKGKTKDARRNIPLTERAERVLKARLLARKDSPYVFPGAGKCGHIVSMQHPHDQAITDAKLQHFEFYCWRHTFGTRAAQSGMDKFSLARLMGHSSPRVAERYYIHVTEPHVAAGFEKYSSYVAQKQIEATKVQSTTIQ